MTPASAWGLPRSEKSVLRSFGLGPESNDEALVELGLCPRCPLGGWGSFGGMPVHTGACAPGPGASLGSKVNRYATAAKL